MLDVVLGKLEILTKSAQPSQLFDHFKALHDPGDGRAFGL